MAEPAAVTLPPGSRLVLASGSPRRAMLLGQAGLDIEIVKPDIDETPRADETPRDYVARLSAEKAAVVTDRVGSNVDEAALTLVVAADTTVECDGAILEKPLDDADARRMLRALGGRRHHVHTGVTVVGSRGRGVGTVETVVVTTAVTFVELTDAVLEWYVGTGEPMDKAGAYAIQERGAALVSSVEGSVTNVVGLPLAETLAMLARAAGRS